MKYCIMCERDVNLVSFFVDDAHLKLVFDFPKSFDMYFCSGPFATCPPPELPENWDEFVTEPSEDELKRMNLNARELELQFVQ